MQTKTFRVSQLTPYHKNPRKGDIDSIAESLETFGQFRTIVVNVGTFTGREHEVLAGNHTLAAARKIGLAKLTATVVDVDEDTASRIVAADNRTSDLAEYDNSALLDLLQSLDTLTGTGYARDDLADLVALLDAANAGIEAPKPDTLKFPTRDAWESASRRLIVLDLTIPRFVWATDALERAEPILGTTSNAETVLALLARLLDEQVPDA